KFIKSVIGLVIVLTTLLFFALFVWLTRSENKELPLPELELMKLTGQTQIKDYGWIKCDIYNGSEEWIVSEITVKITVKSLKSDLSGVEMLSRKYRLTKYGGVSPLTASEFIGNLGFRLNKGQTWSWGIVSAKGRKE
ncbi:MAG: hypothetical protein QME51_11140, partial [Planctomycetota bacterium]|nr:hypothetical protein [Planctomycetota bacterium]